MLTFPSNAWIFTQLSRDWHRCPAGKQQLRPLQPWEESLRKTEGRLTHLSWTCEERQRSDEVVGVHQSSPWRDKESADVAGEHIVDTLSGSETTAEACALSKSRQGSNEITSVSSQSRPGLTQ